MTLLKINREFLYNKRCDSVDLKFVNHKSLKNELRKMSFYFRLLTELLLIILLKLLTLSMNYYQ